MDLLNALEEVVGCEYFIDSNDPDVQTTLLQLMQQTDLTRQPNSNKIVQIKQVCPN